MRWLSRWRDRTAGGRLLRRVLRELEASRRAQEQMAQSLKEIAAAQRILAMQALDVDDPHRGFLTGLPDDKGDLSAVHHTSNRDLAELVEIEGVLTRKLGRTPTNDEVVGAWQDWREAQ